MEGEAEVNGLFAYVALLWQIRQGVERLLEALHGLTVRRAREGAFSGPLPIREGLGMQASRGVVLR
jgi:hypothetical protein